MVRPWLDNRRRNQGLHILRKEEQEQQGKQKLEPMEQHCQQEVRCNHDHPASAMEPRYVEPRGQQIQKVLHHVNRSHDHRAFAMVQLRQWVHVAKV